MNTERMAVRKAARLVKRSPTKIRQLIEAGQITAWRTRCGKKQSSFEVDINELRRVLDAMERYTPPNLPKNRTRQRQIPTSQPTSPWVTC